MKYLVKNRKTGEETLCKKVGVDRFEYYVTGDDFHLKNLQNNDSAFHWKTKEILTVLEYTGITGDWLCLDGTKRDSYKLKKIIATNNKSLDLPQVVDEVEELARKEFPNNGTIESGYLAGGYKIGYKAAKETYQFTKEDMVEFATWYQEENTEKKAETYFGFSDLDMLTKWQEQRTIKIEVE